jgi:hypothetical protein
VGLYGTRVLKYRIFCAWCGFSRRIIETTDTMREQIDEPCICCGRLGVDSVEGRH